MSTITWTLATAPTQKPEYWLLFVDGSVLCSLVNQAPYVGAGLYSVNLTQLDKGVALPSDGAAHQYSVALVGAGAIGPQSNAVSVILPPPVIAVTTGQTLTPPVWPSASNLTAS
jgi:hypothetical protein